MLLKLKLAMLRRNLSQKSLAQQMGTTTTRLSRIVHGRVQTRARERQKIARLVGVPSWRLFPGSGLARLRRTRGKSRGHAR